MGIYVAAEMDLSKKVVLVGDSESGKSCLKDTLLGTGAVDWSDPQYEPTAAENSRTQYFSPEGESELEVWDTAGDIRFHALRQMAYANTDVFVLVFDLTKLESLERLESFWLPEIRAA